MIANNVGHPYVYCSIFGNRNGTKRSFPFGRFLFEFFHSNLLSDFYTLFVFICLECMRGFNILVFKSML